MLNMGMTGLFTLRGNSQTSEKKKKTTLRKKVKISTGNFIAVKTSFIKAEMDSLGDFFVFSHTAPPPQFEWYCSFYYRLYKSLHKMACRELNTQ